MKKVWIKKKWNELDIKGRYKRFFNIEVMIELEKYYFAIFNKIRDLG